MRVELVGDLAGLQDEWSMLCDSDPTATPFVSFQWLSAWCRDWAEGGTPWILLVRDGQRLIGAAPFLLSRRAGLRLIRGMGVGVGNYWDVIAAPHDREAVLAAVAAALVERGRDWDLWFLDKLPEASATPAALQRAGLRLSQHARLPSPRIPLPETFDGYLEGLSKNRRSQIRRNLRSLEQGRLSIREISDPGELRAALARWQALRVEWWRQREREIDAEHGSERFLAFTQEVVLALVPLGRALVWEVSEGEALVGVAVNFLDELTFYYWLWGMDPGFQQLKPGHTLIAHAIRWSIDTNRRYFDFMLGGEGYKYDYAPDDLDVLSMTVSSPRLRSRTALLLSGLKRAARPADSSIPDDRSALRTPLPSP
jgi:CelD/BcsL family acetyltransferase involved in cellulose biosynthesis